MSKTILETVTIPVGQLGHGEVFWFGDNDTHTHVRLKNTDPLLNRKEGKVYSVSRATLFEHDLDTPVSHLKVTHGK